METRKGDVHAIGSPIDAPRELASLGSFFSSNWIERKIMVLWKIFGLRANLKRHLFIYIYTKFWRGFKIKALQDYAWKSRIMCGWIWTGYYRNGWLSGQINPEEMVDDEGAELENSGKAAVFRNVGICHWLLSAGWLFVSKREFPRKLGFWKCCGCWPWIAFALHDTEASFDFPSKSMNAFEEVPAKECSPIWSALFGK